MDLDFKWYVLMVIGLMACSATMVIFGHKIESPTQRKERYAHEVEMAKLQQLTMPVDSTITIDGVRYKLVKQ